MTDPDLLPDLDQQVRVHAGEPGVTVESCDRIERDARNSLQVELDAKDNASAGSPNASSRRWSSSPAGGRCRRGDGRRPFKRAGSTGSCTHPGRGRPAEVRGVVQAAAQRGGDPGGGRLPDRTGHRRGGDPAPGRHDQLLAAGYNPDHYIQLETDPTGDVDVREFHRLLRECTEDTLTGSVDDQYSEAKFLQVKGSSAACRAGTDGPRRTGGGPRK